MPNKNNEEIEEELATSNQAIYISKIISEFYAE